jgi:stage V sporulation protein AE
VNYLIAFLVGGAICALAQLLIDVLKLQPAQVMVLFVAAGAVLSGIGAYERLIEFAQAGALIPVSGFGHSIARGALMEAERIGFLGLFTGAFEFTGGGIAVAVLLAAAIAVIASPKA